MRSALVRGVLLTLAASFVTLVPNAGVADEPPGEVSVQGQAREGGFNTFTGTVRVTCRPGLAVAELALTFIQDFESPARRCSRRSRCATASGTS